MPRPLFAAWTAKDWARASLLVLLVNWLPAMFQSLWLDELGTFWVIDGSFSETISRAWEVQGQSPLTYVLMWGWNTLLTPSDFGLRVLPVLFGLGTLALVYSIAKRLIDPSAGWFAIAAAVSLHEFRILFVELRPYAFGLFFLAASTRLLLAWDDRPSRWVIAAYVVSTAATVWSVYYYGFALIGHLLFVLANGRDRHSRSVRQFSIMVGGSAILCLPLIPQLISLDHRSQTLRYLTRPTILEGFSALLPIGMAGAWLIVTLFCGWPRRCSIDVPQRRLLLWLMLAPPVVMWLLSAFSELAMFAMRYRSAAFLGFSLIVAVWVSGYESDRLRVRAVLVVVAVGLLVSPTQVFHSGQNWRDGLALADLAVGSDGLVVLSSGFIQSASLEQLHDDPVSSLLGAPLSRYPVRGQVLLAPLVGADLAYPFLVDKISDSDVDEIAVVSIVGLRPGFDVFYLALAPLHFQQVDEEYAGNIQVLVYRRP